MTNNVTPASPWSMSYAGVTAGSAILRSDANEFGVSRPAAPKPAAVRGAAPVRGASSSTERDALGFLSTPIGIAAIVGVVGIAGVVAWKMLGKRRRK